MPRKLSKLNVRMIGLVDKGANQEAEIVIAKRETQTEGTGAQVVELEPSPQEPKMAETLETTQAELAAVKAELEALKAEPKPPKKYDAVRKELEETRAKMQAEIDQATKELEESRAEVLKVQTQRRREKFIKRVQELSDLPGAPADDFAEILDHIQANKVTDKEFEKINQLLTSWNHIVKQSKIFQEIGSDIPNFSGPEGQLMALAKTKQAADPKLTYEKAYAQALEENPGLYRAYLKEREGK